MSRVAILGLHTECSTYSPLVQHRADFSRLAGSALVAAVPFDFAAAGLTPVPLFYKRSVPGGPVAADCFEAQRSELLAALRHAGPLDGALVLLHGAMFVPGIDDPEGTLLAGIRAALGPDAILAASFDLHGQMTERIARALDAFAAYRTAPHIDVGPTHARAAAMLGRALAGGPRPRVYWEPVPVLVPGELSATTDPPCEALYAALPRFDARPGVEDAHLMIGYVWADSPRATAAAVVTASDRDAGRAAAREIAANYLNVRNALACPMEALPLAAALDRLEGAGPAILADSGDNPTAGGVGDRADVLAALLQRRVAGALVAGIADPAAFETLARGAHTTIGPLPTKRNHWAEENSRQIQTLEQFQIDGQDAIPTQTAQIGGSLGGGGPRLTLAPDSVVIGDDCAVVRCGANHVVVTRRRRPFHHLADFDALGIRLDDVSLLVVKSGYLSTELAALQRTKVMALTPGAVCQDLARLTNNHRPRPTFPFQSLD